jgi:hypothetical protein
MDIAVLRQGLHLLQLAKLERSDAECRRFGKLNLHGLGTRADARLTAERSTRFRRSPARTYMTMEAFAERARVELEATGERARKRTVDTLGELKPQEAEISRLAALGRTTRKLPLSCSSARARSSTTSARCFASST